MSPVTVILIGHALSPAGDAGSLQRMLPPFAMMRFPVTANVSPPEFINEENRVGTEMVTSALARDDVPRQSTRAMPSAVIPPVIRPKVHGRAPRCARLFSRRVIIFMRPLSSSRTYMG